MQRYMSPCRPPGVSWWHPLNLAEDPISNADVPQLSDPGCPQHLPCWSRSHEPSMGQVPPAPGASHSLELPSGFPSPSSTAEQSAGHHHHGRHLCFCCMLVSTGDPQYQLAESSSTVRKTVGLGNPLQCWQRVSNSTACSGEVLENVGTNSALCPILSWNERLYLELI